MYLKYIMTRLVTIALSLFLTCVNSQITPQASAALDARCPCTTLFQCGSLLGGEDFDDLDDDDNILRNFITCPANQVRCCREIEMIAAVRDVLAGNVAAGNSAGFGAAANVGLPVGGVALNGAAVTLPTARANVNPFGQPQSATGPASGRQAAPTFDGLPNLGSSGRSDIENLLQLFGNQDVGIAATGRQQPDLSAIFAGLEAGTLAGQGAPDVAAVAGVGPDGVATTSVDFGSSGVPAFNPTLNLGPAVPQLPAVVPSVPEAFPLPAAPQLPVPVPAAPQLPVPLPAAPQLPAAIPSAPQFNAGVPSQQRGPQAPSVNIVGPQPIYISHDVVSGPSVDGSGRLLSAGRVGESGPLGGEQDIRGLLAALRQKFLG